MSQSRATKTQYGLSLPNLKHALFDRIQQLHQKNKEIFLKSDNKNKEIVETHIHNKTAYQNTVMKIHRNKVNNVHQSLQQKKRVCIKSNQESMNKAHQNLANIQSRNYSNIEKHMQALSLKLEKAEQNRRKFTQLKAMQRLRTSKATPELSEVLSQQNRVDSSLNASLLNSSSASMQRKLMAQLRREELKRQQILKSKQLLNQSLIKQQQAVRRRNSLKSIRRTGILEERITQAQQHARKLQLDRQNSNILKTIGKFSKFNNRVSQIMVRQDNSSGEKRKTNFKKKESVQNRREDIEQRMSRKKQQLLQRKYAKIQSVSGKKQQMLQTFCQNLHSKVLQRKQKIQQRVQKMKKCERKHAIEQLKKQKQSMVFLTNLKIEKDRIISQNMYEGVQLRHLR